MREVTGDAGPVALHGVQNAAAGTPLVLLHGVGRRWQDWLGVRPALEAWGPVWALDFRGHGWSRRAPDGAYRVADHVADVVRWLDEMASHAPVAIVGHSLGGMVAAGAAAARPGRVAAVVLEDPPFATMGENISKTAYLDLFRACRDLAGSGRSVAELAAALAEVRMGPPGAPKARLGDLRDAPALRFAASCLRHVDPAVYAPIVAGRWLDGYDVAATLRAVACPALLLQADPDAGGTLPDAYAAELAALLPDVTFHKVAGVGHQVHGTAPERFLRPTLDFLLSLD
jgi:pimeloyl-ACP methyl ester carboxylesterase